MKPRTIPSTRAKYIIVEKMGFQTAILFHSSILHSDAIDRRECQPISAGYYWLAEDGSVVLDTIGSVSLNLASRPQDANVIETTLALLGLRNANNNN